MSVDCVMSGGIATTHHDRCICKCHKCGKKENREYTNELIGRAALYSGEIVGDGKITIEVEMEPVDINEIKIGDYVLATKYSDGKTQD